MLCTRDVSYGAMLIVWSILLLLMGAFFQLGRGGGDLFGYGSQQHNNTNRKKKIMYSDLEELVC